MRGRIVPGAWCAALLALGGMVAVGAAQAASCSAASGANRVPLVELYTSEGCDSCPPADRWLATTAAGVFKSGRAIPLALHVDYWDYLGWRDPYASSLFSARQRASSQRAGSRVIYTPQVQVNGRDFRGWNERSVVERALDAAAGPAQARLTLAAEQLAGEPWKVSVSAEVTPGGARAPGVYLVLYENGLVSDVRAGENRGARLQHDFVVREWLGPLPLDTAGRLRDTRVLPLRADINYARAGLVAFVQDGSGDILQALALPLCAG